MTGTPHPKLTHIDLVSSYILGVIYDDSSLTLEMEFHVLEGHPRYAPQDDGECYLKGCIRFADIDDLRMKNEKHEDGADVNLSIIKSAMIEDDYCLIQSNMGEIELTAQSIQVILD